MPFSRVLSLGHGHDVFCSFVSIPHPKILHDMGLFPVAALSPCSELGRGYIDERLVTEYPEVPTPGLPVFLQMSLARNTMLCLKIVPTRFPTCLPVLPWRDSPCVSVTRTISFPMPWQNPLPLIRLCRDNEKLIHFSNGSKSELGFWC